MDIESFNQIEDYSYRFRHAALMADVKANIREVFDLKKMVVDALVADKALLNMIFMKCGEKELKYIKVLGGKIGLVFGLIQMAIW